MTASKGSDSELRALKCRVVVVAPGAGMPLLSKLGFDDIPAKLLGVQTELDLPASQVEVYFRGTNGRRRASLGSSPWDAAARKSASSVAATDPRVLDRFLSRPDIAERIDIKGPATEIRTSVLPLGFLSKSYADRVVVVGEAAGHLKTTTCGGIYYGMLTGEIAADVIASGLEQDRLDSATLGAYETRWRDLLQDEIEYRAQAPAELQAHERLGHRAAHVPSPARRDRELDSGEGEFRLAPQLD